MISKINSGLVGRFAALLFLVVIVTISYVFLFPSTPQKIDIRRLNIAQSIVAKNFAQGRPLFVFESSDCVFCRRIHPELAKVRNVRLQIFILPGHTRESRSNAQAAWCAKDPVASWNAIMEERPLTEDVKQCDATAIDKNVLDARNAGISVTPTLVDGNGRVLIGFHTAAEIDIWLDGK